MGVSRFEENYNKQTTDTITSRSDTTQAKKVAKTAPQKNAVVPLGEKKEPNEIIEALGKDSQFMALSRADKIAKLKTHFPKAEPKDLERLVDMIETRTIATNNPRRINKNDILNKLSDIADKFDIKIDIREFNALVDALTALLNGDESANIQSFAKALKPFAKILDNIVPAEKTDKETWNNLSPRERLDKRLDAFLNILVPDYGNKADEEKAAIRDVAFDKVTELMFPDSKNMTPATKEIAKGAFAKIFDIAENEDVSIEKLMNNPKEAMGQVAEGILDDWGKCDTIEYDSDEWKNANTKEQLRFVIASLVMHLDPSITPDQVGKMTTKEIISVLEPIGKNIFGKEEWDRDPQGCLNSLVTKLAAFNYYNKDNESPMDAKEFIQNSLKQLEVLEKYEQDVSHPKLTNFQKMQRKAFKEMAQNAKPDELGKLKQPSLVDMEKYVDAKLKDKNLSAEERNQYQKMKEELALSRKALEETYKNNPEKLKAALEKSYPPIENTGAYEISTKYSKDGKYDYNGFLKAQCELYGVKDISQLSASQQYKILNGIRDPEHAVGIGKYFNLTKGQVGALLNAENLMQDFTKMDTEQRFQLSDLFAESSSKDAREFGYINVVTSAQALDKSIEETGKKTEAFLTGEFKLENAEMIGRLNNSLGLDKEFVSELTKYNLNNKNIEAEIRGALADSTIKYAPDDETRVYYGNDFSRNVNDAKILEYIGAASKYVSNPELKSQYVSNVMQAAESFPPETQLKIKQAIETGTVISSKSSTPTTQPTTQPTTPEVKPTPAGKKNPAVKPVQQQEVPGNTHPAKAPTEIDSAYERTTDALQQKKDTVLERIEEHQDKVQAEQAAEEIADAAIEEFADAIAEINAIDDISKINEEKIKQFINSNSIGSIYSKLLEKYGTSVISRLINAVTMYGNSSKIDALAALIKSGSLMEELFAKCQSKRLLDRLQTSTVKKFIPYIQDLSAVRSDILYEFIMDLINSNASIDEIKKYLPFLPFGMQASICETYNQMKGVALDSDFALQPQRTTETTEPKQQVAEEKPADTTKPKDEPKPQPAITANEVTAVRNDGVTIKHKSTFAGVSDNYDDEAYEVVDDKTGQTASQREEILTPGSHEWNMKYNKQAPKIAFTMAALEEYDTEDDGIGVFGSTKVGMGQKIKKKYPPQSFRFKA